MVLNLFSILLFGQNRIAIFDVDINESRKKVNNYSSTSLSQIPNYFINFYSNDDRFIVIDRINNQLIKDEKERQKSEDFIDGYIVEQGLEEGVDFILRSWVTDEGKMLNVRYYDVKKSTVLCDKTVPIARFLSFTANIESLIFNLAHDVNLECFNLNFEVVREYSEKKGKTKEILVLAGHARNVSKGETFEIFEVVEEEIGGEVYMRESVIGEGVIDKIQDQNFSIVKIKKGGDVIANRLKSNVKLFCKY